MRLRIILSLLVTVCGHFAFGTLTVKDLPGAGGTLKDGIIYKVNKSRTLSAAGKNALCVEPNAKTAIYIPANMTLKCHGADSISNNLPGRAGILLPSGASLLVVGGGKLEVVGGAAGNGANGEDGKSGYWKNGCMYAGNGGKGGNGGAGGGAGIGTDGGIGGAGGALGQSGMLRYSNGLTHSYRHCSKVSGNEVLI